MVHSVSNESSIVAPTLPPDAEVKPGDHLPIPSSFDQERSLFRKSGFACVDALILKKSADERIRAVADFSSAVQRLVDLSETPLDEKTQSQINLLLEGLRADAVDPSLHDSIGGHSSPAMQRSMQALEDCSRLVLHAALPIRIDTTLEGDTK